MVWNKKIAYINLSTKKIVQKPIPKQMRQLYLGGRGIDMYLLYNHVKPHIDPLSPENTLLIGNGLLCGIPCLGSGRCDIAAKSPLTGAVGDSNIGGFFAVEMRLAGFDHLVITGKSEKPTYIWINDEENFTVILRSKGAKRQTDSDVVLIDDTKPVELKPQQKQPDRQIVENIKEIHRSGHGTYRNIALALQTLFRSKPFSRIQETPLHSSYCTVAQSFNHIETWSSKGRTLLTKALTERQLQPTKKLTDIIYTCSTCGQCFAESLQGLEIDKAIKATRNQIVEKGYTPEIFIQTAKNIKETGDPSAMPLTRRLQWTKTLPKQDYSHKADVLYWVGCMVATRTPNTAKAMANILNHAHIDYTMLGEREGCCNYVLLASGLWKEAKKQANKLITRIKQTNASLLITPCAGCYYTFTRLYPEILGIEMPLQVLHATQLIEKLLHNHTLELKDSDTKKVTYHDPCSLGRHSNVYEPPRNILKAIKNIKFIETPLNKSQARCCGGGGGLWTFNNQVSLDCAAVRLKNDVKPLNVDSLATTCPTCQLNFRFTAIKNNIPIKIYDVAEIVESALN